MSKNDFFYEIVIKKLDSSEKRQIQIPFLVFFERLTFLLSYCTFRKGKKNNSLENFGGNRFVEFFS